MSPSETERPACAVYKWIVIAVGLAALTAATWIIGIPEDSFLQLVIFVLAATFAESQTVDAEDGRVVTMGYAIDLCVLLCYGPAAAAWVAFMSNFFCINYLRERGLVHVFNTPLSSSLFNACNLTLAALSSGLLYELLGGSFLYTIDPMAMKISGMLRMLGQFTLPILAAIVMHIVVNTGLIAVYLGIRVGKSAFSQWVYGFFWSFLNLIIVGIFGVALAALYTYYGAIMIFFCLAPLLLARFVFVQYINLRRIYFETVTALASAVEAKDNYTKGHSQRVESYVTMAAEELHLSPKKIETLRFASILHDIGKIGVSEAILNKPGRLTEEEFAVIKEHPTIGADIVSRIHFFSGVSDMIRAHHVYYDGSGYPEGVKPTFESSIITVADAYDAMTTDRPYRKAMSREAAIAELRRGSGTQFNPKIVDAFIDAVHKIDEAEKNPTSKKSKKILNRARKKHSTVVRDDAPVYEENTGRKAG